MYKIVIILMLPVFCYAQQAQEIVRSKSVRCAEIFKAQDSPEFLVATPYTKSYMGYYGSPFWGSDQWSKADIWYNGQIYFEPRIKYDCVSGQMVTLRYTERGAEFLALVPNCYPEIVLHIDNIVTKAGTDGSVKRERAGTVAERFVFRTVSAEEAADGISSGYYHYRIDKPIPLLCRYSREQTERNGQKTFDQKEDFFMLSGGSLSRIRRVSSFATVFPQWSAQIESFAEQNGINKLLPLSAAHTVSIIEFINTLASK